MEYVNGVSSDEYELAGSRYLGERWANAVNKTFCASAPRAYGLLTGSSEQAVITTRTGSRNKKRKNRFSVSTDRASNMGGAIPWAEKGFLLCSFGTIRFSRAGNRSWHHIQKPAMGLFVPGALENGCCRHFTRQG